MLDKIVVDTNVLVSAILSPDGAAREVLRLCLSAQALPLVGPALFLEYEDVFSREELFANSPIGPVERSELLDAMLSVSQWVSISYLWRPNLPDEADNHVVELAVAGNAGWILTGNTRDIARGELRFDGVRIATPAEFLKRGQY